jgi:hypothetical protein
MIEIHKWPAVAKTVAGHYFYRSAVKGGFY